MKHRAHGPADSRVSPSSTDGLDSADIADTLVAHDVDTRVGAEQFSSEDLHCNEKPRLRGSETAAVNRPRERVAPEV